MPITRRKNALMRMRMNTTSFKVKLRGMGRVVG